MRFFNAVIYGHGSALVEVLITFSAFDLDGAEAYAKGFSAGLGDSFRVDSVYELARTR